MFNKIKKFFLVKILTLCVKLNSKILKKNDFNSEAFKIEKGLHDYIQNKITIKEFNQIYKEFGDLSKLSGLRK